MSSLNDKSVVDAKISDHNPLIYSNNGKDVFCTFNILDRCEYITHGDKAFYNNGFRTVETEEQYNSRLLKIADVIEELAVQYNVKYFFLQEAPSPKIGQMFYQILQSRLGWLTIDPKALFVDSDLGGVYSSGGILTIFPADIGMENITEEIQSYISEAHKQRAQAFKITRPSYQTFQIANFHGKYKYQDFMLNDIKALLQKSFLVGGDFNLLMEPDVRIPKSSAPTQKGIFLHSTYDAIYDGRV